MLQRTLPALLAAALWTKAFTPAVAQAKRVKAGTKAPAKVVTSKTDVEAEVVGSVNSKSVTFSEVIAKAQKEKPQEFSDAIGQVIGKKATAAFFTPSPGHS